MLDTEKIDSMKNHPKIKSFNLKCQINVILEPGLVLWMETTAVMNSGRERRANGINQIHLATAERRAGGAPSL